MSFGQKELIDVYQLRKVEFVLKSMELRRLQGIRSS